MPANIKKWLLKYKGYQILLKLYMDYEIIVNCVVVLKYASKTVI